MAARRDRPGAGRRLFRDRGRPGPAPVPPLALAATAAAALGLAALVVADGARPPNRAVVRRRQRSPPSLSSGPPARVIVGAAPPARPAARAAVAPGDRQSAPAGRADRRGRAVARHRAHRAGRGRAGRGNLSHEIESRLPARHPPISSSTSSPTSSPGSRRSCDARRGASLDQVPMLRGRITRLNGVPVEQATVAPEAQWALRSERGLTYAADAAAGLAPRRRRMVAGRLPGPAADLVRCRAGARHGPEARRHPDRQPARPRHHGAHRQSAPDRLDRLGINFALVFAPGTLEAAPQTHLAAAICRRSRGGALVRRVTDRFPNVSAIPVAEALDAVAHIVGTIGAAVRLTAPSPCRRHAGARRRGRRRPSPPRLRCGGAEGAGRDPRRDRACRS